ncbi:MAG: amidophosphoribosyltransferase [Verrucomicrobiales bacterium]|nr:amidophosphoribosyltransferase [Verrucomicrobiales bacterium]
MSDSIGHECGLAFIRLKKPWAYYYEKYGTSLWAFNKLFLLMEKQHNRGQDGAGIGCCKLNMPIGQPYLFRARSSKRESLSRVIQEQQQAFDKMSRRGILDHADPQSVKSKFEFAGEILLGHLRYGTSGGFGTGSCHPHLRRSNWPTKTLMILGNFNMTNAADLNHHLINRGQHPVFGIDTQTVMEEFGYHLDEQHDDLYRRERDKGTEGREIPGIISRELNVKEIVSECASIWDGGYAIAGVVGNGDGFVFRDPKGIRPCHYYENDELIAFASERVPLMTVFDADVDEVSELEAGHVAVMKSSGEISFQRFAEPEKLSPCSFERIYFSRGNDPAIYQERKDLGANLVPQILKVIDNDLENAVFSFIPNTAEIAFQGTMHGLRLHRRQEVHKALIEGVKEGTLTEQGIDELILRNWPRGEKIAHKDIKLRTFISQEEGRAQLVSHIYDVTYGVVKPADSLVAVDDSIVRGTTLRRSILKILARTNPKQIVVASTAPQIRYPDCYGIDMSELGKFIAFQAATSLLQKRGLQSVVVETYHACIEELKKPVEEMSNCVKAIYEPFSPEEISDEIATLVSPDDLTWKGEIKVIYQTIENLHAAVPDHQGDWYFTGNYPTPGGYRVVNQAFVQFYEKREGRPYDVWF